MPKCPKCNQDIDKVHFKCAQTNEGFIGLDDNGDAEFDDQDITDQESDVTCPICGAIIISNVNGPYDPKIEVFLRDKKK